MCQPIHTYKDLNHMHLTCHIAEVPTSIYGFPKLFEVESAVQGLIDCL